MRPFSDELRMIGEILRAGIFLALLVLPARHSLAFELRDGDVVAFVGDSNTEWGSYHQIVEAYTHLRFPERKVLFYNAGKSGDAVSAAAGWRIEHDVLQRTPKPTKIFATFGVNDLAWGNASSEKIETLKRAYIQGMKDLIELAKRQNPPVEVYVLSYPTLEPPSPEKRVLYATQHVASLSKSDSMLNELCQDTFEAIRPLGAKTLDIEKITRALTKAARAGGHESPALHWDDGVHLNADGNQAMAYAILKLLGAPRVVSSVEIDAGAKPSVSSANGCSVRDLEPLPNGGVKFMRHDEALPFIQGFEHRGHPSELRGGTPVDEFTKYLLKVRNLPQGRYAIRVGGKTLSAPEGIDGKTLHEGVDLARLGYRESFPSSPWAGVSRDVWIEGRKKAMAESQRLDIVWSGIDLGDKAERLREIDQEVQGISARAGKLARPRPFLFSIERLETPTPGTGTGN